MCEIVEDKFSLITTDENTSKYLTSVPKEIGVLENELHQAQQSFRSYVFESTASINALRLRMVECTKEVLDFKSGDYLQISHNKPENEIQTSSKFNSIEGKIQQKLNDIVSNKSLSIKRSLMKLNNLITQHNLLSLPYYELMLYSRQILECQTFHVGKKFESAPEKLSYSKALLTLEEILNDVEDVEDKTLHLLDEANNLYSQRDDPKNFNNDEYKDLPNIQ